MRSPKSGTDVAASILHAELLRDFVESVSRTIGTMMAVQGSELALASGGETLIDLRQKVLALQRNLIMPAYIDTMAAAQERALPSSFPSPGSVGGCSRLPWMRANNAARFCMRR